ncbi:MAG TPA: glycosyltransferase [Solirubrobacteraceae bacterium]|nr:glycosyltransferase [Solirubrobacteraceae bacterium]
MAMWIPDATRNLSVPRGGQPTPATDASSRAAEGPLWAEANRLSDPHRRYDTLRELAETGLTAPRASAAVVARRYLATARGLITALETDAREPVLLNYAGVALYELGELGGAAALFGAADRLAPGETDATANLLEVARRRRGRIDALRGVPADVRAELHDLGRRGLAVAAAAKPATGLRLSLCMIVRDEEATLGECLAAAAPAVDEIVVVDTGSADRTREIAASFGARVIDFPWTGSFAEARNVSFDAATGDWVMFLDADEVLVGADADALRELTGRTWREAFYLVETSFVGSLDEGAGVTHNALRVFRNRPEYRFEGRIHEQIVQTLPVRSPERFEVSSVRVEHYGYLGVVRDAKQKSERNIELLERQLAEGDTSAFLAFNLGSEYAALGDADAALEQFETAWAQLRVDPHAPTYGFAPSLVSRLVKARRSVGDAAGARRFAEEVLPLFPGFTDLVYEQARAARDAGDDRGAHALLERCLEMGDAPSRYTATLGCGTFLPLIGLAELCREADDLAGAERLLRRCLREHPRFLAAVDPLAGAMLRRGAPPGDVVEEVARCVGEMTPSVRFMLGMALYEAGHAADAEPHFRAALDSQPSNDVARVALAEALVSQRRWDEAGEVASSVEPGGTCAPAARRLQLFSLLAMGAGDDARAVLELSGAGDLDAGDRTAFTAWADILAGTGSIAGPQAAGALTAILEALLRVQETVAFATLLPALSDAVPADRDRHELLAGLYLRRGYLDSAADEWSAVCQSEPDVAAMIGLAQVAAARGNDLDAMLFAQAAAELDPADERPDRMLRRLRRRPASAPV